jgi:hypothetical protein
MQQITPSQMRHLNALLTQLGMQEEKPALVREFTSGRATSSKELTMAEAKSLIQFLEKTAGPVQVATVVDRSERANQMRRRILSTCHQLRWELDGSTQVDMERVNEFCKTRGYLKKPLNAYTYQELPKLVSQFDALYMKYLKGV